MSGRHQHARQRHDGPRPALDTRGNAIANDGLGEFQKPALDDPLRLVAPEEIDEPMKFLGPFRIAAAMSHEQDCWFHCGTPVLSEPDAQARDFCPSPACASAS